jgi:Big-like domain-containing protein
MRIRSLSVHVPVAAALLAGGGLLLAHCQALLTAPAGSTLQMVANPMFIPAHGGVSVISVVVVEPAGTVVPDGTVVQFFTTLGHIDEQGRTNDGVARVNLLATGLSGKADVTAISGGQAAASPTPAPSTRPGPTLAAAQGVGSATLTVAIGTGEPTRVVVTSDPPRATARQPATIRAIVIDDNGNPVANVPVFFRISPPVIAESMASGGNPVYTDTNGIAEDVLRTTAAATDPGRTVTVEASAAGVSTGTVIVRIN